jgi:hypothetical protein
MAAKTVDPALLHPLELAHEQEARGKLPSLEKLQDVLEAYAADLRVVRKAKASEATGITMIERLGPDCAIGADDYQ